MPPIRTSETSGLVLFTYKRRKVVFARPATYEGAINQIKKTFAPLKYLPPERIGISACLPDYREEGVVEITAEAWQLAADGVKHFTIGIIEDEPNAEERKHVKKEEEGNAIMASWEPGPSQSSGGLLGVSQFRAPLQLQPGAGEQGFWVCVRTLETGNHYIHDLYPSDTVYRLKARIQNVTGCPTDQQRLIFGGAQLEERRTLADSMITNGVSVALVLRLRGAKPVIYLYPPSPINVKVQVSLAPQWKFSAVYPKPLKGSFTEGKSSQIAEWDVVARPNGTLMMEGTSVEVAYIFWEAEAQSSNDLPDSPPMSRSSSPLTVSQPGMLRASAGFVPGTTRCSPSDSVVMSVQEVPPYLEKTLLALGFHTEARTSFITYWLPSFLKHDHIALRFVPQVDFEASAPLDIDPKPDVVTRVFMLFEGIATDRLGEWDEARERSLADVSLWKGVVGVEEARQNNASLFRVWNGEAWRFINSGARRSCVLPRAVPPLSIPQAVVRSFFCDAIVSPCPWTSNMRACIVLTPSVKTFV